MNVIFASFWSKGMEDLSLTTWASKVGYCRRHGYEPFWRHHAPGADIMWDRPRRWAEVLRNAPDGAFCVFTGADVFITRPDLPLSKWVDDEHDAFLLSDHGQVFGDAHIWRACDPTRDFLRAIGNHKLPVARECGTEQMAIAAGLSGLPIYDFGLECEKGGEFGTPAYYSQTETVLNRGSTVRVKLLNLQDFCGDDPANWWGNIPPHHSWSPNHLMLHLGGLSVDRRLAYLKSFIRV